MSSAHHHRAICDAMMRPDLYPHPVARIERRETHISSVFLTGPFVYKIKKAVDLGFLDFSTLDKRRRCCRQEVVLNRRLAHGVYLDVVPITRHAGAYHLNGLGDAVEFAVKMVQLADSDAMPARLRRQALGPRDVLALADLLTDFYAAAAVCEAASADPAAWEENLQQVEGVAGAWIDHRQFAFVQAASRAFTRTRRSLFDRRRTDRRIKHGHGDLRSEHIYFTPNGIQIVDCVEFSERLRCLDVASDLAFLAMDLAAQGFDATAAALIRRYVERSDDLGALPLLNFYRCYRAMVRCKVSCCRLRENGLATAQRDALEAAASRYLAMAHDYAAAFSRPTLWMVCGLPGSGKSTLARAVAAVHGLAVIRSDALRKTLFPDSDQASEAAAFGRGMYSAAATEATYREMLLQADEMLKSGASLVVDATFSRGSHRLQALRMADRRQARSVLVECRAATPVLTERLRQRETQACVSDARRMHLEAFQKRFEPLDPDGAAVHIRVDTAASRQACLRHVLIAEALPDGDVRPNGPGPRAVPATVGRERG
jgi:aminoglycoside phosphotransferase family enzyme/predicted kinase